MYIDVICIVIKLIEIYVMKNDRYSISFLCQFRLGAPSSIHSHQIAGQDAPSLRHELQTLLTGAPTTTGLDLRLLWGGPQSFPPKVKHHPC
jgi:hypothetical protein